MRLNVSANRYEAGPNPASRFIRGPKAVRWLGQGPIISLPQFVQAVCEINEAEGPAAIL